MQIGNVKKETMTAKAVKSDNTEVPEHLWKDRVAEGITSLRRTAGQDFQFNLDHPKDIVNFEIGL